MTEYAYQIICHGVFQGCGGSSSFDVLLSELSGNFTTILLLLLIIIIIIIIQVEAGSSLPPRRVHSCKSPRFHCRSQSSSIPNAFVFICFLICSIPQLFPPQNPEPLISSCQEKCPTAFARNPPPSSPPRPRPPQPFQPQIRVLFQMYVTLHPSLWQRLRGCWGGRPFSPCLSCV